MRCYCLSDKPFSNCCQPTIEGKQSAQTCEQLMRSRYSAYCVNTADYLVATHWPVDIKSKTEIQSSIDSTQWVGLKIIHSGETLNRSGDATVGSVEFVAFYQGNGIEQLHEKSFFKKIEDRWFYLYGEQLPPVKIGRNELCFCGSGKKYKKCHFLGSVA